jgi:hypothetical protein
VLRGAIGARAMSLEDVTQVWQGRNLDRWLAGQIGPLDKQLALWGRAESRWSLARLAAFLLAAVAWVPLSHNPPAALLALAAGIALFVWTIMRHRHAAATHSFLRLRKTVMDEARRRAGGHVVTIRSTVRPRDVAVAAGRIGNLLPAGQTWALSDQEQDDLDLYAEPTGIFGLLNRTSTDLGAMRLRDCLENLLLEPDRILARQEAVRWLAEHHAERIQLLAALAGLRGLDAQAPIFEKAVTCARPILPVPIAWLLRLWSVFMLGVSMWAAWRALEDRYGPVILLCLLTTFNVFAWVPLWTKVRRALLRYQRSFDFARGYLAAAQQAARDLPPRTQLFDLQRVFDAVRRPEALPKALRWISWSASGGFVQMLLDLVAFYDVHILEGIQRHIVPHREQLLTGLDAVAELEALLSLACFAAEQPNVSWPETVGTTQLSIRRGVHPMIEPSVAVPNDVQLSCRPNLWIITGSNMSGKSTLLRMAGVNVLLAQLGGAVSTEAMAWSPLRLISDLRTRESLTKGESYFLAEVRHLRRMIVCPAGDGPVLGLVDEPFRGTNHREQRAATLAVIEHLTGTAGLFLIATHDTTITRLADGVRSENHHFQEQLGQKELLFDYQLRPGPARTRNALRVLQREQYPADLVRRALEYADGGENQEMPA